MGPVNESGQIRPLRGPGEWPLIGGSHGTEAAALLVQKGFRHLPEDVTDLGFLLIERGEFGFGFEEFLEALTDALAELDPLLAAQLFSGFSARFSRRPSNCGETVLRSLHASGHIEACFGLIHAVIVEGFKTDLANEVRDLKLCLQKLGERVPDGSDLGNVAQPSKDNTDVYSTASGRSLTIEELAAALSSSGPQTDHESLSPKAEGFYRWDQVLELISSVNLEKFQRIEALLEKSRSSASGWAALAELAERSQLEDSAIRIAESRLVVSDPFAWFSSYDGGSKLKGYRILTRLKGEDQRERGLDSFTSDMRGKFPSTTWLLFNLRELFDFFCWQWPEEEGLSAAIQYLQDKLIPNHDAEPLVLSPKRKPSDQTWQRAIVNTLVRLLDAPFSELATPASDCIHWVLVNRPDGPFLSALTDAVSSENPVRVELILTVLLKCIQDGNLKRASEFKPTVELLYKTSRDIAITRLSGEVCRAAGWTPSRPSKELSPIYSLAIARTEPPSRFKFQALELEGSPVGLTLELFSDLFQGLVRLTDIPKETLRHRAESIYAAEKPKFFWARGCENFSEKWKAAISSAQKYTFPQFQIARHSMMILLQELVDGGALLEATIPAAGDLYQILDPDFVGVRPSLRPPVIPIPEDRYESGKTWMQAPSERNILDSLCRSIDSRKSCGEITLVRSNFFSEEYSGPQKLDSLLS